MCKLGITLVDESKDLYVEKSGQSSCQRAKTVLACGRSPQKAVPTRWKLLIEVFATSVGSLRYGDYGLRTTAGRALSFVRSTGLSRANIER